MLYSFIQFLCSDIIALLQTLSNEQDPNKCKIYYSDYKGMYPNITEENIKQILNLIEYDNNCNIQIQIRSGMFKYVFSQKSK